MILGHWNFTEFFLPFNFHTSYYFSHLIKLKKSNFQKNKDTEAIISKPKIFFKKRLGTCQ